MTPLKTRLCRTLTSRPLIMAFDAMLSHFALVNLELRILPSRSSWPRWFPRCWPPGV